MTEKQYAFKHGQCIGFLKNLLIFSKVTTKDEIVADIKEFVESQQDVGKRISEACEKAVAYSSNPIDVLLKGEIDER